MKKLARQWLSCLPGVGASLGIAVVATLLADLLDKLLGTHLIGAAVIAMFIGMGVNAVRKPGKLLTPGLKFTSKKLLKFAIILLGASLSIDVILDVGRMSLLVMVFTLATCFGLGYFSGRALGLNWKMSNLISAGTGICGGSAIAAIAPTIDADDTDVAFAMSATFLFDMAMILLFPLMGRAMGLSDQAFGLWAGTAVNDTSSVVATGYAFSEAAGDFATMVKLTRTLCIIPTVIIFALISVRLKRREALAQGSTQEIRANVSIAKIFPWFILGFVAMACLKSLGCIPDSVSAVMKDVSKFLMVAALAAIGMNTSFATMRKSGARPMLHGFIISALVVIVAIAVEYAMHLMGWLELFAPAA
ncbi:MAG: YeiH family putative sulfate export transporter [Clostridia bacterium]|nr:YeiH family putative sulfate export transporter [Clostridia bacterium]